MFRETIGGSGGGLCIVYSLQMGGVLQFSTRLITQTEAMLTSVERLTDFANTIAIESGVPIQSSSSDHENPKTIPGKWPQKGADLNSDRCFRSSAIQARASTQSC